MRLITLALVGAFLLADTNAIQLVKKTGASGDEDTEDADAVKKQKRPEGVTSADEAAAEDAKDKLKAWKEDRAKKDLVLGSFNRPADAASRNFEDKMAENHIRDKAHAKLAKDEAERKAGKSVAKDYDGKKDEDLEPHEVIDKLASGQEKEDVANGKPLAE